MKTIIVTGTPGTGKTTLAKKLAEKLGFCYIDVNKIIKKYSLSEGYDRKRKAKIVDVKKLNMALIIEIGNYKRLIQGNIKKNPIKKYNSIIHSNKNYPNIAKKTIKNKKHPKIINKKIKNGIIIDSHLSHYLPKQYADLCIVTKCGLNVLKKRLEKKKYGKNKIRENLDAEIFDICLNEAKENRHKVIIIDTAKGINIGAVSGKVGDLIGV